MTTWRSCSKLIDAQLGDVGVDIKFEKKPVVAPDDDEPKDDDDLDDLDEDEDEDDEDEEDEEDEDDEDDEV